MNAMKQTLFSNWHVMRWLRLVVGIIAGIQAVQFHETILGFLSAFLLLQSLTSTGCCGADGCASSKIKDAG
jgi:hypothetical protein